MKMKSLIVMCCLSLFSNLFAADHFRHVHPKAGNPPSQDIKNNPLSKGVNSPGYCEIEIINSSYDNVRVSGVFDDGTSLAPFNVYSYERPHYIDLYYYGYCHAGMTIWIDTFSGYRVYAGYTYVNSTVRIVPYLNKQLKAEITAK